MTNKELLDASLLDIIFDKRNKEYGAYALRSGYNKRMMLSLGIGLSVLLFFILFSSFRNKNEDSTKTISCPMGDSLLVSVVDLTPPLPEKIEPKKELPRPVQPAAPKMATAEFTNIKIVPNEQVLKPLTQQTDLTGKQIDIKDGTGIETMGNIIISDKPAGETGTGVQPDNTGNSFVPSYTDPEYPGGQEALSRFLSQNLATPNDLETGEKKMVRVRFKVDTNGVVTGFEIEQTAGAVYDKEVIRVCKKMRRWKPALQNGSAVPVSYVLPVTFIGIEQ